mgnify:CR=1 FL=1
MNHGDPGGPQRASWSRTAPGLAADRADRADDHDREPEPDGLPTAPRALLPLAEQLPEARAGRSAIAILDAVQQTAAAHGYFAAGEEAARRLRAARELRSTERRFVSDGLADILRGLRRLRTLADRKKLSGRALYVTYLLDKHAQAAAPGEPLTVPRVLVHKATEVGLAAPAVLQRAQELAARLDRLRSADLAARREWEAPLMWMLTTALVERELLQ